MARATPRVEDGVLRLAEGDQTRSLRVGTPAWFAWLAGATAFAFADPAGGFTARQEAVGHGRGGRYWKASRRVGGRLRRAYLGRSEDLTLARLESAAAALAGRAAAPAGSPTNLPASLTSFVGREGALAELAALLPTTRLLTLAGAGGVGKTRLALELARSVRAAHPDGVWLVDLAPLADPRLVEHAVAAALRVADRPGRPLLETLTAWLAGKRLLLVLDNCEHLLDACAALAEALLRACPDLRLLATSREPLGIAGETTWRVPSLTRGAAVRLFVERAGAVLPGFAVTELNADVVAEVCRRLDGIPLAVELAAAWTRILSTEQIATRLDDRFQLLTGGSRMALPRHQTLRAAIDWSFDLLTEVERAVLRRLAVFAGGWTLDAAEAVCAGNDIEPRKVLDLVARLADKSLAQVEAVSQEARGRLLETVRQYAAEKLDEAGEAEAVRARHAAWCAALAERAEPALGGLEQLAWLDRLDAEHDNLRAALRWRLDHQPEAGLRLAGSLWPFWRWRQFYSEGRGWLERLLDRAPTGDRWQAKALRGAGCLAFDQGDLAAARARLDEGLALSQELGETRSVAWTLRELANVHVILGDRARARRLIEEGLALSRAIGDPGILAATLITLGRIERRDGDHRRARAALEEGLALARTVGDRALIGEALGWLGQLADVEGDYRRARACGEEALAIAEEQGAARTATRLRWQLANIAVDQGDHARATALYAAGLAAARQREETGWLAWHLVKLGRQALLQGDAARATTLLEEGLDLLAGRANQLGAAEARCYLGLAVWRQGDAGRAMALLRESLAARQAMGDPQGIVESLEALAAAAAGTGRPERAARLLGAAEELRRVVGAPLPPVDRPDHNETTRRARAAIGEAAFAAAWAAGRALTVEQAVAKALGDPSLPPADERAAPVPPPAPNGLSRREVEVLRLVAAGRSNREVAAELAVSVRTVERHITNLYGKIGARNRADAAIFAVRHALA